jgi:circadian clock protein KaiC
MERVKTGIPGLDEIVYGGIPRGLSVLVTGSCGTGKTIFSLQYLFRGARDYGEPGVYVTFEESRDKVMAQAKSFGWDFESLEKKKLLSIYDVETDDEAEILEEMKKRIAEVAAKRIVLDSLTTMVEHAVVYRSGISKEMSKYSQEKSSLRFPTETGSVTRKDIYFLINEINKLGQTAFLISEVGEKSEFLSRDTISEFAADGVIMLQNSVTGGQSERLVSVRKMRGTEINIDLSTLKFTKDGVEVVKEET